MILQFYLLSPNKISLLLKIAFNSGPWTVNQGGDQQPLSIFHNIWTTTHALYGCVTHVQSIYGIICFVYDWGAITEIQYKNGWGFNRKSFTIFYRNRKQQTKKSAINTEFYIYKLLQVQFILFVLFGNV